MTCPYNNCGYIAAAELGVIGNGIDDDYANLQTAIDSAIDDERILILVGQEGNKFLISAGLTATILSNKHLRLYGTQKATILAQQDNLELLTINFNGSTRTNYEVLNGFSLSGNGKSNCSGLIMTGSSDNAGIVCDRISTVNLFSGFQLNGVQFSRMDNCFAQDCNVGILTTQNDTGGNNNLFVNTGAQSTDVGWMFVGKEQAPFQGNKLIDCISHSAGTCAFFVKNAKSIDFDQCQIESIGIGDDEVSYFGETIKKSVIHAVNSCLTSRQFHSTTTLNPVTVLEDSTITFADSQGHFRVENQLGEKSAVHFKGLSSVIASGEISSIELIDRLGVPCWFLLPWKAQYISSSINHATNPLTAIALNGAIVSSQNDDNFGDCINIECTGIANTNCVDIAIRQSVISAASEVVISFSIISDRDCTIRLNCFQNVINSDCVLRANTPKRFYGRGKAPISYNRNSLVRIKELDSTAPIIKIAQAQMLCSDTPGGDKSSIQSLSPYIYK